jgi:hypothetical protein
LTDTHYTTVRGSGGYDRELSPRATIGAHVSAEGTNYSGPTSFRVITPQLTATLRLSEFLVFNAAAGVGFASIDNGIDTRHSTGFTGNASLCSLAGAGSLCVHGEADEQTATTAGPARSIGGGIDYSRQLSANSSIAFSLGGNHYSQPISVVTGGALSSTNYFHATASFSHKLGSHWFGGVNLSARKLTQAGPDPKSDFNGSLFIRYRFGNVI